MASQVIVTVKAANGLVDDFEVNAQSNWTIQQLKNYLYRHYSTHPVSCSLLVTFSLFYFNPLLSGVASNKPEIDPWREITSRSTDFTRSYT